MLPRITPKYFIVKSTDSYHAAFLYGNKLNRQNALIECCYDRKQAADSLTDIILDAKGAYPTTLRKNGSVYQGDIHEVIFTRCQKTVYHDVWTWHIYTRAELIKEFRLSRKEYKNLVS